MSEKTPRDFKIPDEFPSIRGIELFLLVLVICGGLWLIDDYIASYISVIFLGILIFILVISLIAEMLDRSRVPRRYFYNMVWAIFAIVLAAMFYLFVMDGNLEWLEDI